MARWANALGPVHLGLETRPSRLRIGFPGGHQDMNLLMNLDLIGAVQKNGWTAYGTVGREPPNSAVRRRPHAARCRVHLLRALDCVSDRQGLRDSRRTIPARLRRAVCRSHGVHAHPSRSRSQRPGLRPRGQRHDRPLVGAGDGQPRQGRGDPARRGHRGFSTAGRWQFDVTPRAAIVGSAFYRHSTDLDPKSGAVGGAFGFAPTSRVSIWTEVDANLQTKAAAGTRGWWSTRRRWRPTAGSG